MLKTPLRAFLLLTPALALAACAKSPADGATPSRSVAPAAVSAETNSPAIATELLPRYFWRLTAAHTASGKRLYALFVNETRPVTLRFVDGTVQVSGTCNTMRGRSEQKDGRVKLGPMMATRRGCAPELMALDLAVASRLQGELHFTLEPDEPRLTFTTPDGDLLAFVGAPTPETRFGSVGETVFLEVAPRTEPCRPPSPPGARCLEVREVAFPDGGEMKLLSEQWQQLHGGIEGFEHTADVRQIVRVTRYQRNPVPPNAFPQAYVLDLVLRTELPAHSP